MPHARQQLGQAGEAAAVSYLEGLGYEILAQNWHAGRYGEIDIVAQDGVALVVIEVKARQSIGFGYPEEAVNKTKQDKLRSAAQAYVLAHPQLPAELRFDVVAVVLTPGGEVMELKHYRGAME